MCLAVPGKILEISPGEFGPKGKVSFGGLVKEVNLSFAPKAQIGNWVLVHAGFAISIVDEMEAERVYRYLDEMQTMNLEKESKENEQCI